MLSRRRTLRLPLDHCSYNPIAHTHSPFCGDHLFVHLVASNLEIYETRKKQWIVNGISRRHHNLSAIFNVM